jgi:hypothetical protein
MEENKTGLLPLTIALLPLLSSVNPSLQPSRATVAGLAFRPPPHERFLQRG